MEPVSTKHGTPIPPITGVMCGQDDIKLDLNSRLSETGSEPEGPPPELWLSSLGGESFLIAGSGKWAYHCELRGQHGKMAEPVWELTFPHIL